MLVGVNNLCRSAGRICTQQKKGVTLSDYTFFDNALKRLFHSLNPIIIQHINGDHVLMLFLFFRCILL